MSNTKTIGLAVYRKVKIIIKYMPTALPANPNLSYDISAIDTNKTNLEETPGQGVSAVLFESIWEVEENSSVMVAENNQELQSDLGAIM